MTSCCSLICEETARTIPELMMSSASVQSARCSRSCLCCAGHTLARAPTGCTCEGVECNVNGRIAGQEVDCDACRHLHIAERVARPQRHAGAEWACCVVKLRQSARPLVRGHGRCIDSLNTARAAIEDCIAGAAELQEEQRDCQRPDRHFAPCETLTPYSHAMDAARMSAVRGWSVGRWSEVPRGS
jgi:hypothetical protein